MNPMNILSKNMNEIHDASAIEALAGVDLNLLVAFAALVRESSVTRAAERVGVTQSAMSHALRRLRELLDDPLLVRGRGGMVLTPRAEALGVAVRGGLTTLARALLDPLEFEPRTARRRFRLASPDLFDALILPPLLALLRRSAPGIDLTVLPLDEAQLSERLETGEIDVGVVPRLELPERRPRSLDGGLMQVTLLRDSFVCFLRAKHPVLTQRGALCGRRELSIEAFLELSHALVSPTGEGPGLVDAALAERGLTRRLALRLPSFATALTIVTKSDLVLTAPAALARLAPRAGSVIMLAPPLALPRHSVNLVWHERFTKDPAHAWLRGVLTELGRATR